jgi:fructose-specific phosphotransferase system IIC component
VTVENPRDVITVRRRIPVVIAGGLFIAAGIVGLAYHAHEIDPRHPFEFDVVAAAVVRLLAIVGGVFVLLGRNWARWLLIAWLAYHVVLSAFHSAGELAFHFVLLVVISWLLFRAAASAYFHKQAGTSI